MNRLVGYLALCLGCYGPTFGILAQEPVAPPHNEQAAFDYACYARKLDCSGVTPPAVEWHAMLMNPFLGEIIGGYDGGDAIHLSIHELRVADPVYIQAVLAHETSHYLDVQLGITPLPYTHENVCQSEYRAYAVDNVYLITHGRADLADFGWAERYGCFR